MSDLSDGRVLDEILDPDQIAVATIPRSALPGMLPLTTNA